MSTNTLKGSWNQFKGKIKEEWAKLTDDDLLEIEGHKDKLVGKLQERYDYSEDQAKAAVDKFASRYELQTDSKCCEH